MMTYLPTTPSGHYAFKTTWREYTLSRDDDNVLVLSKNTAMQVTRLITQLILILWCVCRCQWVMSVVAKNACGRNETVMNECCGWLFSGSNLNGLSMGVYVVVACN